MSVMARYTTPDVVEYIGECDGGTLWFHLNLKSGKSTFFDNTGKEIGRPELIKDKNLYSLVFGDGR